MYEEMGNIVEFKHDLRKQLKEFKQMLKLLEENKTDELKTELKECIKIVEESLQD